MSIRLRKIASWLLAPASLLSLSSCCIRSHSTELREAANPVYAPEPPLAPGQKVTGWVGKPDPAKFSAGTNSLTPAEAVEEAAKGNIVLLDDWVGRISSLELWEKRALYDAMMAEWMQNR